MTAIEVALAGYLAFGQPVGTPAQIMKHAGLQVIHADGGVTSTSLSSRRPRKIRKTPFICFLMKSRRLKGGRR